MSARTRLPRSPLLPARRARLAALAAAVALLGALGCGSDSTSPSGGVTGKYDIVSVTGPQGTDNSAPFVLINQSIQGQQVRAEITSGSITLGPAPGGRYSSAATVKLYVNGIFAGDESSFGDFGSGGGVYTVTGSSVTLTPDPTSSDPNPTPITGTLSGGTMTFSETVDDATLGHMSFTIVLKK